MKFDLIVPTRAEQVTTGRMYGATKNIGSALYAAEIWAGEAAPRITKNGVSITWAEAGSTARKFVNAFVNWVNANHAMLAG